MVQSINARVQVDIVTEGIIGKACVDLKYLGEKEIRIRVYI